MPVVLQFNGQFSNVHVQSHVSIHLHRCLCWRNIMQASLVASELHTEVTFRHLLKTFLFARY